MCPKMIDSPSVPRGIPLSQILFAVLLLVPGVALADKASDDFNLGVSLYRSERYETAADAFAQFLREFPQHPRANTARLYQALSLNSLEQYEPARSLFVEFLKSEGEGRNAADARYRLAECSYYLKDYPAAIAQFREYLQKHSGHTLNDWARLFLGDSYTASQQWSEAEATLKPLLAPTVAEGIRLDARMSLGRALEGLDRPDDAIQQYVAVVSGRDTAIVPRALSRIGTLHYNASRFVDAAAAYEQLLKDFPQSPQSTTASLGAGMSYFKLDRFEDALPRLQAVPRDSSSGVQALLMAAMSLKRLGRVEESQRELDAALKEAGNTPLAAEILFQQAQLTRETDKAAAAKLLEHIADRWPAFDRAADCLSDATELLLELDDVDRAERLWQRLDREFLSVSSQPRAQVLRGRIQLARGQNDAAAVTFEKAAGPTVSAGDRPRIVARYYLVRTLSAARDHARVLEQATLLAPVLADPANKDLSSALALAAISSLELKDFPQATQFAESYLTAVPEGTQKVDVTAIRAIALSELNRTAEALQSFQSLVKEAPENPQTWSAVLQAANAALQKKQGDVSEPLFALAVGCPSDAKVRESGASGIAWSQHEAGRYSEAAQAFAKFVADFPASTERAQALFMSARCIEQEGDLSRSATAYADVFMALTQGQPPAEAGAESEAPLRFAYDAGRQAARSWQKLNKTDEADRAWAAVLNQFPAATDADRLLDEWAWLNAEAGRYERSDEIHRRLLKDFPSSPYAGQARLSLAESELAAGRIDPARAEFEAIVANDGYGAADRERSLFHLVEIHTTARDWPAVASRADSFLSQFSASPLTGHVRLFRGEAALQLGDAAAAETTLSLLRDDLLNGRIPVEDWADRVWIALAETALARKDYATIDRLESELRTRSPKSPFAFQLMDVQGRRWKQQAPPDFDKARRYFVQVTQDESGRGTRTAARCQFLIAETFVMQSELDEALKAYFAVYLNYDYDDLRAQSLFQAAACQVQLKRPAAAERDFKELLEKFPQSEFAAQARDELARLQQGTTP
jgi:TolA-binding protein